MGIPGERPAIRFASAGTISYHGDTLVLRAAPGRADGVTTCAQGQETLDGEAGDDRVEGGFNHEALTGGRARPLASPRRNATRRESPGDRLPKTNVTHPESRVGWLSGVVVLVF